MKLRKGDQVRVITGKDKGKDGVIERVNPKKNTVVVSGVNTASKHQRATRADQQAGIVDVDMPINASNVMYLHNGRPVRLGYSTNANGEKVRIARPSGEEI